MGDEVIRAIADPGRRTLLDALRARDGQTVGELAAHLPTLGRHAVLKHLGVLSDAGLVTTRKIGRQRFCHLEAVPLVELARRWLDDYSIAAGSALLDLRDAATGAAGGCPPDTTTSGRTAMTATAAPHTLKAQSTAPDPPVSDHVSSIVIAATPERVWTALTDQVQSARWYFATGMTSTFEIGAPYACRTSEGVEEITGTVEVCEPPRLLVMTFGAQWDDEVRGEPLSRVRWDIVAERDLTRVTLTHTGLSGSPGTTRAISTGWPYLLSNLKTLLETGAPMTG